MTSDARERLRKTYDTWRLDIGDRPTNELRLCNDIETLLAEPPAHGDHAALAELRIAWRNYWHIHGHAKDDTPLGRLAVVIEPVLDRPRAASVPDAGALLRELRNYIHGDAMPDMVQVSDWIDRRLDCLPDDETQLARAPQPQPAPEDNVQERFNDVANARDSAGSAQQPERSEAAQEWLDQAWKAVLGHCYAKHIALPPNSVYDKIAEAVAHWDANVLYELPDMRLLEGLRKENEELRYQITKMLTSLSALSATWRKRDGV